MRGWAAGRINRLPHRSGSERYRLAFEFANVGIGIADLDGKILEANQSLASLLGYSSAKLREMNVKELWALENPTQAQADFDLSAGSEQLKQVVERHVVRENGDIVLAEVTRGMVSCRAGNPRYFTFTVRDITETRRIQAMLEEQASTDALTGAMNRRRIEERGRFELMRSDRYGNKLSLIMIDLDHFKAVNDAHGHRAGDLVLKGFCEIARGLLRSIDILGRWGGEEFVALLPETSIAGAEIVAERMRAVLEVFRFENGIRITASLGVASHREDEEFSSLQGRADACLYQAKLGGRNQVVLDPEDLATEVTAGSAAPVLLRLHWRPAYLCGEPAIDADHLALFGMANRIIASVTAKTGGTDSLDLFRELIRHLDEHFAHEEQSLLAAGYPGAAEHVQIHRDLGERARNLAERLERGEGSEVFLLRFLVHDIVAKHMVIEDKKFFNWFNAEKA